MVIKKKKGAIELDLAAWWIISIVVLALILIGYFIFKGKGDSAIDFINQMLKFRR
jgi:hypothetical protein